MRGDEKNSNLKEVGEWRQNRRNDREEDPGGVEKGKELRENEKPQRGEEKKG